MIREYHLTPARVAGLSTREFMVLLGGLSEHARWPRAYADTPLVTNSPADIAAALGSYYGPESADPPPGGDPPDL